VAAQSSGERRLIQESETTIDPDGYQVERSERAPLRLAPARD
jgi:hypothetical protein